MGALECEDRRRALCGKRGRGRGRAGCRVLGADPSDAGEKHLLPRVHISPFTKGQLCHRHAISIP